MRSFGTTQRQIPAVAAKNHTHSVHNPLSQFRQPFTALRPWTWTSQRSALSNRTRDRLWPMEKVQRWTEQLIQRG
jgi:hypothetical protein